MTESSLGSLDVQATLSSPQVQADPDAGLLCLAGESYPENTFEFYRPINAWLDAFLARDPRPLTLELRLSYLNTSSIKCLIDLLDELEAAHQAGRGVVLNWYYDPDDDRAMELAEEFKEDLTLPFHIVPLQREG
jgi:sugar/nucleoside kinase (ribokinase family)